MHIRQPEQEYKEDEFFKARGSRRWHCCPDRLRFASWYTSTPCLADDTDCAGAVDFSQYNSDGSYGRRVLPGHLSVSKCVHSEAHSLYIQHQLFAFDVRGYWHYRYLP